MKRLFSGIIYVVLVVSALLLRQFVDYRIFCALIFALTGISACEMANVTKGVVSKATTVCTIVFGFLLVPVMFVTELLFSGYGWVFGLLLIALSLVVNLVLYCVGEKTKKSLMFAFVNALYPTVFMVLVMLCNQLPNIRGFVSMVILFAVSACADVFAYFIGRLLKGPKLWPELSPKKTWAGAFGAVIGGVLCSLLIYLVFGMPNGLFNWWIFLLIGVVSSVLNIFGDLFESFIKRSLGIKDIGNIMPGHGGVLDRIDGLVFVTLFVYPIMLLL